MRMDHQEDEPQKAQNEYQMVLQSTTQTPEVNKERKSPLPLQKPYCW